MVKRYMIDFYYWPTPNGWKVSILLEELGIPYKMVPVNIGKGDQFDPNFLEISPITACQLLLIMTFMETL